MEESPNSTFETRQDHMISSSGFKSLRPAHFLKPSLGSNKGDIFNIPPHSLASLPHVLDSEDWPLTVSFHGRRQPQRKWKEWVEKMIPLHQSTWKEAGIYDAILSSTYKIHNNDGLVFGFAERWCPETSSFIFPWGETTITLEDMMVISGYSVLGSSVAATRLETEELKEIEAKLIEARKETLRSPSQKAYHCLWLNNLKDSGSEIEHEAFLSLWLSRFVLPASYDIIRECVFPIAIHLARGTTIALAPAVLASIYRDLSLLKGKIVALTKLGSDGNSRGDDGDGLCVAILSPFQLVQAWVWERFPQLRPQPNLIDIGQPRLALWHGLKQKLDNVRTVLSSKTEIIAWRPYAKSVENWSFPTFYGETEMWVSPGLCSEEFLSFAQCLRASPLEGLGCTENYFPHRVARQFGFDQDVPFGGSPSPYTNYRPFDEEKLYIPSRNFEADVTARYVEWWKESMLALEAASSFNLTPEVSGKRRRSKTTLKESAALGNPSKRKNVSKTCPCQKKQKSVISGFHVLLRKGSKEAAKKKGIAKLRRSSPLQNSEIKNKRILGQSSEQPERCLKRKLEENNARPPAGTSKTAKPVTTFFIVKKTNSPVTVAAIDSPEKDGLSLTIAQILKSSNLSKGLDSKQSGCVERSSGPSRSHSSSIGDNGVVNNVEPPKESLEKSSENEVVLIVEDGADNNVEPPKESLQKSSENEAVLIVEDGAVNIEPLTKSSEKSAELDCEAVEIDEFPNNLVSSPPAAPIVQQVEATENENCGNLSGHPKKVRFSTAPNRVLENLEPVPVTVGKVGKVQVETTEDGNAGNPSGQSPEIPSSVAVNGSPKNPTPGMTASKMVSDRVAATTVGHGYGARGGNAAATSEIERIWLRLEAKVSWIEKRLIEMKKKH